VDVDDVLIPGQHQAFGGNLVAAGVAAGSGPAGAGAVADLRPVDPRDAGQVDGLDRPGQVPVQAGRRPVSIGAEARHDALLVWLHPIEPAGDPQGDHRKAQQRQSPPAAEPAAGGAAQQPADEVLCLGDQPVQVGDRSAAAEWPAATERPAAEWSAAALAAPVTGGAAPSSAGRHAAAGAAGRGPATLRSSSLRTSSGTTTLGVTRVAPGTWAAIAW